MKAINDILNLIIFLSKMPVNKILSLSFSFLKIKLGFRIPFKVTFHVTYQCNLKCNYCCRNVENEPELDTIQIKNIMRTLKKAGTKIFVFNGGEPLLRNDINELLIYAKDLNFFTMVTTNGTLIKENIVGLRAADYIQISINEIGKSNDSNRKDHLFSTVVNGINILKSYNKKMSLITVLNKGNVHKIEELFQFIFSKKINICFQPIHYYRNMSREYVNAFVPTKDQMKNAVSKIIKFKKNNFAITNSYSYLNYIKYNWPDVKYPLKCSSGKTSFNITPGGNIAPCCIKLNEKTNFNITSNGIKNIFKSIGDHTSCYDCMSFAPLEQEMFLKKIDLSQIFLLSR